MGEELEGLSLRVSFREVPSKDNLRGYSRVKAMGLVKRGQN